MTGMTTIEFLEWLKIDFSKRTTLLSKCFLKTIRKLHTFGTRFIYFSPKLIKSYILQMVNLLRLQLVPQLCEWIFMLKILETWWEYQSFHSDNSISYIHTYKPDTEQSEGKSYVGSTAYVSGWGITSPRSSKASPVLKAAQLTVSCSWNSSKKLVLSSVSNYFALKLFSKMPQ